MPAVFEFPHTLQPHEIDDLGHVNNIEYLRWLQDAAVEHSAAQGWTTERYRAAGAVFVARSHQIEYLQPAFVDEEVRVLTWVSQFGKITTLRKYLIVRPSDQTVLVKAQTNWAFLGWPNRTPRRIPPELVESFIVVPEDAEPGASS